MLAEKAITLSLGDLNIPVISWYQFAIVVSKIYKSKEYNGEHVNLQKGYADSRDVTKYLEKLLSEGVIVPYKNLPGVGSLLGRMNRDPDEIACTVDPFCYISHLSAMAYHSLTDRIPSKLFISTPPPSAWNIFAQKQMQKDLGNDYERYINNGLPKLTRIKMTKINKTEVSCFSSKHHGAYKRIHGRSLKVSTIGRTFLDMIRNPDLCGGLNHVLNVYREFGELYLRLITDEIDRNGTPIDKVRTGYILDEIVGIHDNEVIENWVTYAQRGGSRKLDSSSEYIPEWSDKWKISINI